MTTTRNLPETDKNKLNHLCEVIAFHAGLNINLIKTKTRDREYVDARRLVVMVFTKYKSPLISHAMLGSFFNKDHSSIIHLLKTGRDLLFTDRRFTDSFKHLEREYLSMFPHKERVKDVFHDPRRVNNNVIRKALLGI